MAGVSSDGGGEKLNTELNLVPFIDLLSTLVLFLLISAVWTQISAIPAAVSSKGKRTLTPTAPEDRLTVNLTPRGHELTWPEALQKKMANLPSLVARTTNRYDFAELTKVVQLASAAGALPSAAITAEDEVPYGQLVETIDAVKQGGVASIVMSAN